jgi:predicted anti-sigma-YlaC factor YlaD
MPATMISRPEKFLRYSRRGMAGLLGLVLALGGLSIAMALQPGAELWPSVFRMLPIVIAAFAAALVGTLRGDRWDPRAPEAQAIVQDEWRRANMDRARRLAFALVLVVQVPLALLFSGLPVMQALMAMAVATMTVGMSLLLALFLYFDRDSDGR